MPRFGAHMSIAGGLHLAFERIISVKGEALQVFTRNQRQWAAQELSDEAVERFLSSWEKTDRMIVASHANYLANLAATDLELAEKSVDSIADELRRAEILRIPYLVLHPGSRGAQEPREGIKTFTRNLDEAVHRSNSQSVMLLIENTAGQGSGLGSSFEEIRDIIDNSHFKTRLGVCFDTCHAYAAGFDIKSREGYRKTFQHFDRTIGLDRLKFFHINDSKKGLGSRVDRHWHIGKGELGIKGFSHLVNDPLFRDHPMVLETPKGKDLAEDKVNLAVLRSLVKKRSAPAGKKRRIQE